MKTDDDVSTLIDAYKIKIENPTRQVEQQLAYWLTVFEAAVIHEAISRTHKNGKSFSYLTAILSDFNRKGVKTLQDIVAYDQSFKRHKQGSAKQTAKQESFPLWASPDYKVKDEPVDEATIQNIKDTLEGIRSKK
ncbi:DnaD domain protein [Alkalibacterium putridalgicola]|uniref:DnaD domain protein n=1 Tax=Alkalibacterium putridalgicola TaxID=426703 RepID=UPI0034CDF92C